MPLLPIIILGGVILSLLCFLDYKKNVLKPINYFTYYVAFCIFTLMNWAIYFTLCFIFLRIDVTQIERSLDSTASDPLQLLTPIVIALSYFGVGAGSFKIGTMEFRFYSLLLELFQNLFQMTEIALKPPGKNQEGESRYELLEKKVIQLRAEAEAANGWDKLEKDWHDTKTDSEVLIEQIEDLTTISDRLGVDLITKQQLDDLQKKIKEKISHLWCSVNLMVSRFIIQLIFKNIKDRKRIEQELKEIGWLKGIESPVKPKLLSRLIGISLITGMLFGLITAFGPAEGAIPKSPIISMWCGAIGVIVFSLFFSRFDRIKNIGTAIILGAMGGYIGHFTWILLDRLQTMSPGPDNTSFFEAMIYEIGQIPYPDLIIGALYGAFIAAALFACCFYGPGRCKTKYCLVTLIGGCIFVGIHLIFSEIKNDAITPEGILISLFGGMVVLLGMSFATNIFHLAKDKKTT